VAAPVTVPRLGWSMDEGTFVEWLKREGDEVRAGDPLFVLESEKAAEPVESLDAGILRIAPDGPQVGETVKVGRVLAYLVSAGESIPDAAPQSTPPSHGMSAANLVGKTAPASPATSASSLAISPRARRVARALGIDCTTVRGTGAGGRIRERDVRAAASMGRIIPHTAMRRLIAARMVAGMTQAAPVTLTTRADATELVALRNRCKADGFVPGYTSLIVKLAAAALGQHPQLQAQWRDDGLLIPDAIAIAVAVDTDAGLLAPVVRGVDRLSLRDVAVQLDELADLARAGRLSAEQMRDATFTVTNLGMHGIDAFTPIVHLPQCAVLGVGRIVQEPAVVEDRIVPRALLTLSLTFDHRAVDGAPAARFLDALRRSIEQPGPLLD
jgi:pyruvate dehydrogenase E2 component (dihydrolipoamide acetyltransferase)